MADRLSDINRELATFRQELASLQHAVKVREDRIADLEEERLDLQFLLATYQERGRNA